MVGSEREREIPGRKEVMLWGVRGRKTTTPGLGLQGFSPLFYCKKPFLFENNKFHKKESGGKKLVYLTLVDFDYKCLSRSNPTNKVEIPY